MTERPFLGGSLTEDIAPDFHFRNGTAYWKKSYAADRIKEAYEQGVRETLAAAKKPKNNG